MSDDLREIRSYFAPPLNSFWKWVAGGEAAAWGSGETITFRDELAQVLERLAPDGLPPLGAVLLLLAAARENWAATMAHPFLLAAILVRSGPSAWAEETANQLLRGLDRIHQLRGRLPMTTPLRAELADVVFETYRGRTTPTFAAAVVRTLKTGLPESVLDPGPPCVRADPHYWASQVAPGGGKWHSLVWLNDARGLQEGLDRVDPERLALRLRTGLDDIVKPAAVELSPAEQTRALITRLQEDDELSGLARLARNLMAAVTLPRALSDPEDLPLGGVSDISNRGPLDRLLLSELAHDDLTLAVRVANGEALYLRRESPPRTPPRQRVVLLESGIRSWGVPRVFATAVALALAATTDAHTRVVCYRARGPAVVPVDLCSRAGLVEHLAALELDAHPGEALAAFRSAADGSADPADLVLVASADVLGDRDFQAALAREEVWPLHAVSVCRDGRFQLQLLGPRGGRVLRTALLDLDELLAARKPRTAPLIAQDSPRDLPAILSVKPFPLLLPHALNPRESWHVARVGVLSLSRDRRLTLWTAPGRGPILLADDIPPGALLWASPEVRGGIVQAVVGQLHNGKVYLLTIHPGEIRCASVLLNSGGHYQAVCAHNGFVFAVSGDCVDVFDQAGNLCPSRLMLPEALIWQRGRFFRSRSGHNWVALAHDGQPVVELALMDSDELARTILTLFECRGVDGAVGITGDGRLYFTSEYQWVEVRHGLEPPLVVQAVSRSGDRLVLSGQQGKANLCAVAVEPRLHPPSAPLTIQGDPFAFVERLSTFSCPRSLRTQWTHIGVSPQGALVLCSRKNTHHAIELDALATIRLAPCDAAANPLPFRPTSGPPGVGYALKVATWPDGSRAFLDSRGLLHLKSADLSVPEATLILSDRQLSGWCSDGRLWGTPYFLGEATGADAAAVYRSAIRGFTRRLT